MSNQQTPEQRLVSVTDELRHALDRITNTQTLLTRFEQDYRLDPAERQAVAALTGNSRLVEEWRYARVELSLAELEFTAGIEDLADIADDLDLRDATSDPDSPDAP